MNEIKTLKIMIKTEKFEEILKKRGLENKNITSIQDLYDSAVADFQENASLLRLSSYTSALKDIIVEKVDSEVSDGAKKLLFKLRSIQRALQMPDKQEASEPLKPDSCPYCHRTDEGRESQEAIINDSDLTVQIEVDTPIGLRRNDGGFMSILYGPKKISQIHIYYCPMCGRKLNEPKD